MRKQEPKRWLLEKRGGASSPGGDNGNGDNSSDVQEPEIPGMFPSPESRFIATPNPPTEQDRVSWMRAREEPIPLGVSPELANRFRDNQAMSLNVLDRARITPANFRGLRDSNGNLQAGAIITDTPIFLYVDFFASAPWNIFRNSPKTARDAGTALMAALVKESMNKGYGGEVRLSSLSGSVSFYKRIGFEERSDSEEMILTRERAIRFLSLQAE